MDILSFVTTSVACVALFLILGLFLNLRKANESSNQPNSKEVYVEAVPALKQKKKTVESSKPKHKKQGKQGDNFKHSHLVTNLKGHMKSSSSGTFSQNGKYMASCDGEHSIFLWVTKDFNKGNTCVRVTTDYNEVGSVAISPDSKAVIATLLRSNASRIYRICKKDISTGNPPNLTLEFVTEIADLHPESALVKAEIKVQLQHGIQCGAYIYHQYEDTSVVLTDLKGIELYRVKCGGGKNSQIQISNCGKYFAVCGDSPELRAWTIIFKSGKYSEVKRLASVCGHKVKIVKFNFSPDSTRLITLDKDDLFIYWNMDVEWINSQPPTLISSFKNTFGNINRIVISADNHVIGVTQFARVTVFVVKKPEVFYSIDNLFENTITKVEFDPTSNFFAVTGDRLVRIFENLTVWKSRLLEYEKEIQLVSNPVHKKRLEEQIVEANQKIKLLEQ